MFLGFLFLTVHIMRIEWRLLQVETVNIYYIQKINPESIVVNEVELPIARAYEDKLFASLKIG
jgi:hypothetical protein